jgi:hypothetical protein
MSFGKVRSSSNNMLRLGARIPSGRYMAPIMPVQGSLLVESGSWEEAAHMMHLEGLELSLSLSLWTPRLGLFNGLPLGVQWIDAIVDWGLLSWR